MSQTDDNSSDGMEGAALGALAGATRALFSSLNSQSSLLILVDQTRCPPQIEARLSGPQGDLWDTRRVERALGPVAWGCFCSRASTLGGATLRASNLREDFSSLFGPAGSADWERSELMGCPNAPLAPSPPPSSATRL